MLQENKHIKPEKGRHGSVQQGHKRRAAAPEKNGEEGGRGSIPTN
jgi:hypothetical protein